MVKIIHVHEVLDILKNLERGVSKEELFDIIKKKFGPSLRFSTCGTNEFNFDEIVEFMIKMNKIDFNNNIINFNKYEKCLHE